MKYLVSLPSTLVQALLLLALTLYFPLSGDNELYLYMADLLLKGMPPYLGSWDNNFPGVVLIHAGQLLTFGRSESALHLYDMVWQLLAAFFMYRIALHLTQNALASWFTTIAYIGLYVSGELALCAERDCYTSVFLLAALWQILIAPSRANYHIAALLLGCTILLRPTAGVFPVVYLVWLYWTSRDLKRTLSAAAIAAAPVLMFFATYGILRGLDEFYESVFLFNSLIYARVRIDPEFFYYVISKWYLLLAVPFGFIALRGRKQTLVLLTLLVVAGIVVLLFVYRFPYHYHPLMTVLLLIAGIGVARASDVVRTLGNWLPYAAVLVYLVGCFVWLFKTTTLVSIVQRGGLSSTLSDVRRQYDHSPEWGMDVKDSLAECVVSKVGRNARVQSLTSSMLPMFKAEAIPSSRFTSIYNLSWLPFDKDTLTELQLRWRKEYMAALNAQPPRLLVFSEALPDHIFNNGRLPTNPLAAFHELREFVDSRYPVRTRIGGYWIAEPLQN